MRSVDLVYAGSFMTRNVCTYILTYLVCSIDGSSCRQMPTSGPILRTIARNSSIMPLKLVV